MLCASGLLCNYFVFRKTVISALTLFRYCYYSYTYWFVTKLDRYWFMWSAWLTLWPSRKATATLLGRSAKPLSSGRLVCLFDENIYCRSSIYDKFPFIYIVRYSVSNVPTGFKAVWLWGEPDGWLWGEPDGWLWGEPDGWPDQHAGRWP